MFLNPFVFVAIGIIGFTYYLHWKELWKPNKFWNYGAFNTMVYSLILFVAFLATINVLAEDDAFESYKERIAMHKGNGSNAAEVKLCFERDSLYPNNVDYQKDLVDALMRVPETFGNKDLIQQRDNYKKKLTAAFEKGDECEKLRAAQLLLFGILKLKSLKRRLSMQS